MSKLTDLKSFLTANRLINPNVVHSMIDSLVAEQVANGEADVAAVIEDVDTFKTVATPVADPEAGEVTIGAEIALTSTTKGATIYYTVDGTVPTDESLVYNEPVVIEEATTLNAIAYKGYQTESAVLTAGYTIAQVATPVADPVAGEVVADSTVALTSATEGAIIYYTVDGTTPTDESLVYEEAVVIAEATTIKAIAYADGYLASEVLTAEYTVAI